MSTASRVFFDTNILVYQFDRASPTKQKRAQALVEEYLADGSAMISSQVVQEFMNVALNKFATPMTTIELRLMMSSLLEPLCQHTPTTEFYARSLNLLQQTNLSFYDGLIVQAAIDLRCQILYSEDLQDGGLFGGVAVVNPFKPGSRGMVF